MQISFAEFGNLVQNILIFSILYTLKSNVNVKSNLTISCGCSEVNIIKLTDSITVFASWNRWKILCWEKIKHRSNNLFYITRKPIVIGHCLNVRLCAAVFLLYLQIFGVVCPSNECQIKWHWQWQNAQISHFRIK